MGKIDAVFTDNLAFLEQAADLVRGLSAAQYVHSSPPLYVSGIGPHLRHCLDHYELFTTGWQDGRVDYDLRPRRDVQEREPKAMLAWIADQQKALFKMDAEDLSRPVKVKMDCGSEMMNPWSDSSVFRELQFLISHTVHHFALVAMMLHDQGLPVPANFGVAPSTLHFQTEQHSCAP